MQRLTFFLGVLGMLAFDAAAQQYPQRAITLVNPSAPGGTNEIMKSVVFDRLAAALGVPIVMESKGGGGAGGAIAAEYTANAPADGYTLLLAGPSVLSTNPATRKSLPYDPVRDFTPIVMLTDAKIGLVVGKAVTATNVREFVAAARARPGTLDYGSYGSGTTSFLAFELFKTVADVDAVHVPYRGGAPLLIAMLSGQVQASFDYVAQVRPHHQTGALRMLGIASAKRASALPDVPTLAEQGYPVEAGGVQVLVAPAGLPPEIADRLNAEINRILALPEVRQRFAEIAYDVLGGTREQAATHIATELVQWRTLVQRIRFEPQ